MKVAVIQLDAKNNKAKNVEKALRLVRRAIQQKAKFILLPEVFVFRGRITKSAVLQQVAEDIPGSSTRAFMELAEKHKVFILAGSLLEKAKGKDKAYNSSVLINDRGRIQAKYRKMNLFDAVIGKKKIKESEQLIPGRKPVLTKVREFKVGMSICYDLRFPDLYRKYSTAGVDVLCVPSAFTEKTGRAHWETLLRARAIETLCYVLAPNQIGRDSRGIVSYGNSMIINPWGEILARASGKKEEIIFAHLKRKVLEQKRSLLPSLINKNF